LPGSRKKIYPVDFRQDKMPVFLFLSPLSGPIRESENHTMRVGGSPKFSRWVGALHLCGSLGWSAMAMGANGLDLRIVDNLTLHRRHHLP